jgi:hypothetical protein
MRLLRRKLLVRRAHRFALPGEQVKFPFSEPPTTVKFPLPAPFRKPSKFAPRHRPNRSQDGYFERGGFAMFMGYLKKGRFRDKSGEA